MDGKILGVVIGWVWLACVTAIMVAWRRGGAPKAPPQPLEPSKPWPRTVGKDAPIAHIAPRTADLHQIVAQAHRNYMEALEAKLRGFMAAGVGISRIQLVTHANCPECHGMGTTATIKDAGGRKVLTISECSLCPGYVIDWDQRITG